jgi:hypothetical protein
LANLFLKKFACQGIKVKNITARQKRKVTKFFFCGECFFANIEHVGDVTNPRKGNFVATLPLPPDWPTPVESRLWRSDLRFRLFWNGPIGTPDRMALF